MTVAIALLILISPFAVAAALSWAAHRNNKLRFHLDQFRMAAPMAGRIDSDYEWRRVEHDIDAIRTRFEREPTWPSAGVLGERR